MLEFFEKKDNNFLPLTELVTAHNGYTGGSYEKVFYIKNNNNTKFYTDISVLIVFPPSEKPAPDLYTKTGWSVKAKYGSEQPSEEEWSSINVNASLNIPDIGKVGLSDTTTHHPIWVRVYCPGYTDPTIKDDVSIQISYIKKEI